MLTSSCLEPEAPIFWAQRADFTLHVSGGEPLAGVDDTAAVETSTANAYGRMREMTGRFFINLVLGGILAICVTAVSYLAITALHYVTPHISQNADAPARKTPVKPLDRPSSL
jgi:hypothetical protein